MAETKKMKVGLLGLMFDLYEQWPEIKPKLSEFANTLHEILSALHQFWALQIALCLNDSEFSLTPRWCFF